MNIQVTKCDNCPFIRWNDWDALCSCGHREISEKEIEIKKTYIIPDFCPLRKEDAVITIKKEEK